MAYYGALEAGGTKMVLAVFGEDGTIQKKKTIPTGAPDDTMPQMISFFLEYRLTALGIGSFGPLDLDPASPTFGNIRATPKLKWRDHPLASAFYEALGVPVVLDTDVNAAALAESMYGAAKGLRSCAYVTVGTGIGGGLIVNGAPVHGMMHPEIGHILLKPDTDDPLPEGVCPYHGSCLEGLASGPAMLRRWGIPAERLPDGHRGWALEAGYLAQLCADLMLTMSPEKIILGGGVMQNASLYPQIRRRTVELLNGYIALPEADEGLEKHIVPPGLGKDSGIIGAYCLARHYNDEIFARFPQL